MTQASTADGVDAGTGTDLARQVVVLVSALVAVVVSTIGSGAFGGTPIADAAGGALSADATLVAPGGPAFSIWSLIYAGLVALAVWQVLPAQRTDARQRRTGWQVVAALLLNPLWILTVQAELLVLSVVVIAALLAVLLVVFVRLREEPPGTTVEGVVVDGSIGLYLGWVSIATVANLATVLADADLDPVLLGAEGWAAVGLLVAALLGVAVAARGRGRFGPAAALCWGLVWIAVARTGGEPTSYPTAVVALLCALVVAGTTLAVRAMRGS